MDYHCMIDFETLDLGRNPVVISICAVLFDTKGVVLEKFYHNVNPARCQRAGLTTPWSYKQERCYRTFRARHQDITIPATAGTAHNALDDALYQVEFIRNVCTTKKIEVL